MWTPIQAQAASGRFRGALLAPQGRRTASSASMSRTLLLARMVPVENMCRSDEPRKIQASPPQTPPPPPAGPLVMAFTLAVEALAFVDKRELRSAAVRLPLATEWAGPLPPAF